MKRILLASPVRGGLSTEYCRALLAILTSSLSSLSRGKDAPYFFEWCTTKGTSVAMARDELANVCLTQGYDEMIFWDIDCSDPDHKLMLSMFARLLSHDVDIVGMQYVGHNFQSQFHGAAVSGAEPRRDGLLEMGQIPQGKEQYPLPSPPTFAESFVLSWHQR